MSEDHVGDLASSTPENLPQGDEVLAILKDVVKVPEKFPLSNFSFLKDVVVVDSIRSALKLRPIYPGKTFVTMDGTVCLKMECLLEGQPKVRKVES